MSKKTKEQISFNMKRVKNKDSDIELLLRKELWRRGLRYRKNVTGIIGKPDIVFKSRKVAVFCDSEFFHGYNWEVKKQKLGSNRDYWIRKIERNKERDRENDLRLIAMDWIPVHFWGQEILKNLNGCVGAIEDLVLELRVAGCEDEDSTDPSII